MMRMRTVQFFPFCACCLAVLTVEKPTFGGFDEKLVRRITIRHQVGVEPSEAHLRRQEIARVSCVSVLQSCLISTLV